MTLTICNTEINKIENGKLITQSISLQYDKENKYRVVFIGENDEVIFITYCNMNYIKAIKRYKDTISKLLNLILKNYETKSKV